MFGRASAIEHLAQAGGLKRRCMMIEPPSHALIGRKSKIDASVVIGIELRVDEGVAITMNHADRIDLHGSVEHVAVKRCKKRS